jgi:hypothetical protein
MVILPIPRQINNSTTSSAKLTLFRLPPALVPLLGTELSLLTLAELSLLTLCEPSLLRPMLVSILKDGR